MLMAPGKRLCWQSYSDAGDCRTVNEDRLFAAVQQLHGRAVGLFAVADGCGGLPHGAQASEVAIQQVGAFWATDLPALADRLLLRDSAIQTALEALMQRAHAQVVQLAQIYGGKAASTLSVLLLIGHRYWIRHVGDTRIYRLHGDALEQLTQDQSMVADLLRNHVIRPEDAKDYARSILTMGLGVSRRLYTYQTGGTAAPDDVFCLCSDGLYACLPDGALSRQLRHAPADAAALRAQIPPGLATDNLSFLTVWRRSC